MIVNERYLSLAAWLASMIAAYFWPGGYWLLAATTVNLLHFRFIDWWCGASLRTRVMTILKEDLASHEQRLARMEKEVADIKDAQLKFAASFRGRALP